jgi:hypothetical protein
MGAPALPRAPQGLSRKAAKLWRDTVGTFELSAPDLETLAQALRSLDRADQAAAIVDAEGPVVLDRYDTPKSHPAVDVELRHRRMFTSLMKQLDLVVEQPAPERHGRNFYAKPAGRPAGS